MGMLHARLGRWQDSDMLGSFFWLSLYNYKVVFDDLRSNSGLGRGWHSVKLMIPFPLQIISVFFEGSHRHVRRAPSISSSN
jgi:hypothetical protein